MKHNHGHVSPIKLRWLMIFLCLVAFAPDVSAEIKCYNCDESNCGKVETCRGEYCASLILPQEDGTAIYRSSCAYHKDSCEIILDVIDDEHAWCNVCDSDWCNSSRPLFGTQANSFLVTLVSATVVIMQAGTL